jgi:hypothetical protein
MKSHKKSSARSKKSCDEEASAGISTEGEIDSEVLSADEKAESDDSDDSIVLGLQVNKARGEVAVAAARGKAEVAGGTLPFTGASILTFVAAALGLLTAGGFLMKGRRSQS